MDDVRFDQQIVVEEIGREGIVGVHAADAACSQKNDPRAMRRHPAFDFGFASQPRGLDRAAMSNVRARAGADLAGDGVSWSRKATLQYGDGVRRSRA
jgi:hypothetical protein